MLTASGQPLFRSRRSDFSLARYGCGLLDRTESYVVPSRHSAYKMPATLRVSATIAMPCPRRLAISVAHYQAGSRRRERQKFQLAWPSARLTAGGPALVMPVRRFRSELECSPGVSPRKAWTACAEGKRLTSSSAATNRIDVTGPTPGTVMSR